MFFLLQFNFLLYQLCLICVDENYIFTLTEEIQFHSTFVQYQQHILYFLILTILK